MTKEKGTPETLDIRGMDKLKEKNKPPRGGSDRA